VEGAAIPRTDDDADDEDGERRGGGEGSRRILVRRGQECK
jgi:hypothetical protein